jgi:precorrin-6B methylase 2
LLVHNNYQSLIKGLDIHTEKRMEFSRDIGLWHEPTRRHLFVKAVSTLQITNSNSFMDIGCGKGFVLIMASQYPFAKIAGIELSEKMYQTCLKNLKKHDLETVDIILKNATDVSFEYDEYDTFFMYNPFKENVVKKVVRNLINSVKRKPRKIVMIYHNPLHGNIFIEQGFKIIEKLNDNHIDQTRRIYIYQLDQKVDRDQQQ